MSTSEKHPPENDHGDEPGLVPLGAGTLVARDPYGPRYGDGPADDDFRRSILSNVRMVLRRRGLILAVAAAALAVGTLWTLMTTPLYTATVRLQIDSKSMKIVEGGQVVPSESGNDFLRTQIELLRSRAIVERVVKLARLADDEEFFKPRQLAVRAAIHAMFAGPPEVEGLSKAAREADAASTVSLHRSVRPVPGARLVDVAYTDASPERAQRIANAFAEAFIVSNLDRRFQANVYAKAFLEDQLTQLKIRLDDAETAVISFAEREEFVVTSDKAPISESSLSAANIALGGLVTERIKAEQLWRQVEGVEAVNLPQFLMNPVIQGLRTARNALETEYKEKLQTYKPGYPAMIQISERIREIDRQIAAEVRAIKGAHKGAYEQALQQESEMQARIEMLRVETLDLQRRSIQYNNLRREAATLRTLHEGLLQRYKEVDVAGGIGANNIFVVDKARTPTVPSSPNLGRALILSLALGLGGGLGAAFLLERLDDVVRAPDELEEMSGLATLGIIPRARKNLIAERALQEPRSPIAEAYRSLCTALQFATDQGLPKSLLITSVAPNEGKSITSLAIAIYFSNMGRRVLIVDADLRNPSMHDKLDLDNSLGLSNYLTGSHTPPETFQATLMENVTFMASGPLPPNAADLLAGPRLASLLTIGAKSFDLIVIDGPPVLGLADVPLLSNAAAATVLVVGAGEARGGQIRGALKRLHFTRRNLIGTVLTKFNARSAGHGYAYSGYSYIYGGRLEGEGYNSRLMRS